MRCQVPKTSGQHQQRETPAGYWDGGQSGVGGEGGLRGKDAGILKDKHQFIEVS